MKLSELIAANRRRQERAGELNRRAGMDLFKVYARQEIIQFLSSRLGGARRQAEVSNAEALMLPELPAAEVERVERENPLTLVVCNRPFEVRYGTQPIIWLGPEVKPDGLWRQLPDTGVFLPSGRQVFVSIGDNYNGVSGTMIPEFKIKVRDYLNLKRWNEFFCSGEKPVIALPDPGTESPLSPIYEYQYGTCAVTGQPLKAFGTVAVRQHYIYSSDPNFEVHWTRNRDEAEALHIGAAERLNALRKEAAERKLVEAARAEAQASKERVKDVYGLYRSGNGGSRNMEDRLYERAYGYLPEGLEDLRRWKAEADALAQLVLVEMAETKKAAEAKAAEENRQAEEQAKFLAPLAKLIGSSRAELARGFADELAHTIGAPRAHRELSEQFNAPYGRERRQSLLSAICGGRYGREFQALHQAREVSATLEGAIFWLEYHHGVVPSKASEVYEPSRPIRTPAASSPAGSIMPTTGFGTSLGKDVDWSKLGL